MKLTKTIEFRWTSIASRIATVRWLVIACCGTALAQPATTGREDFALFENRIRPVLVESCYHCHNSIDTAEAGLALDTRDGIRRSTEHGRVVVPGKPDESLLLRVIGHEIEGLEMPDGDPQLAASVVNDFRRWILAGAPDPRDAPPTAEQLAAATSWQATLAKRKQWWSFQPIVNPVVPPATAWSDHPVDSFVARQLAAQGLVPSPPADRRTLIRRLHYVLTGLPPTAERVQQFLEDDRADAMDRLLDELLGSEHFGERWARHWMDLVRYADSHGSEGDPAIPHAYRYRDYVIRALNADVPYDQLVREHVAGDLLPNPRINQQLGINESAIGTSHWRFVFHGFAPTDALDEKVRFTDDQINTFTKAFLGLTVSCARCHDHKFDAISQSDYYAMFGILASCRPALLDVNTSSRKQLHVDRLTELKQQMRRPIAQRWLASLPGLAKSLANPNSEWDKRMSASKVLAPLAALRAAADDDASSTWDQQRTHWLDEQAAVSVDRGRSNAWYWNLAELSDFANWYADGNGLADQPSRAGDFVISLDDNRVIDAVLPAGIHTRLLSTMHRGFLGSPRILLDDRYQVWLRVSGQGNSTVRYAVENYPRNGTVYPIRDIQGPDWKWQHFDLTYWQGDYVHFEVATARDAPLVVRDKERSWFGIREVVVRRQGEPAPHANEREFLGPLFRAVGDQGVANSEDMIQRYVQTLTTAIEAWRDGNMSDDQSLLISACLAEDLLPNSIGQLAEVETFVDEYKRLESELPEPTRVPGLLEADAFDQPLFERGNHRRPLEPVRRRFLEAIDATAYRTDGSGRLELAYDLVRSDNPFTARVIVNRIWNYLFGQPIVSTTDNFGRLGTPPTHPELLDYLAHRFQRRGWSIKDMVRFLLLTKTWQQDSTVSKKSNQMDPENKWLSHANTRRLDAEAIRDTLLAVSGVLDRDMFGPGVAANRLSPRRSVYVMSRRNSMDQFLQAFDAPLPFSTVGRRNQTNVPAQSLMLLNDPQVIRLAGTWADRLLVDRQLSDAQRVERMFTAATGRPPTGSERHAFVMYVQALSADFAQDAERRQALAAAISDRTKAINEIVLPVRKQIEGLGEGPNHVASLRPISCWEFTQDFRDSIGKLDAEPHGEPRIEDGALVLDGNSYLSTPPVALTINEKSLEAWVQLSSLDQRGGAAVSLQDLSGHVFDAIVFGERKPREWVAGSDGFRRTDDFQGSSEESALTRPVHIVITYHKDGTVRGYRDGQAYGRAIRKSDLATFKAQSAQVLFGLRHGPPTPGRFLQGRVLEARLYNRALSANEVSASAAGRRFVADQQVLAALDESRRQRVLRMREETAAMKLELSSMDDVDPQREPWRRLAHALFNLKEFIYVR